MNIHNDLLVSTSDAEALAAIVGHGRRSYPFEAEAAEALADVLSEARKVPGDRLPDDRVSMNARVTYREETTGERRKVAIVRPAEANPSEGRVSVLSPVGRALLGRKAGAVTSIHLPGARALTLRVLAVERDAGVAS